VELLGLLVATHLEVLLDGQAREHIVVLGYEPDALGDELVGSLVGDVVTIEQNCAGVNLDKTEQCLEKCRLAGAVGADDADQLSGLTVEVGAVEDVHAGQVAGDEIVGSQNGTVGLCEVSLAFGRLCGLGHDFPSNSASASWSSSSTSTSVMSVSWWAPR